MWCIRCGEDLTRDPAARIRALADLRRRGQNPTWTERTAAALYREVLREVSR